MHRFLIQRLKKCIPQLLFRPFQHISGKDGMFISYCVVYIRQGCSKFFQRKQTSSQKKSRQTLANAMFIFNGTCCPTLVRKTLMCDILKFVPSVCSPVTLHSVAAAPKHLRFALRCWSFAPSPTSSDTSTPELSGLPSDPASWNLDMTSPQFRPPSFQGKAFFRQALATLSPYIFLQNEIYQ